jgi:uncharacterized protein
MNTHERLKLVICAIVKHPEDVIINSMEMKHQTIYHIKVNDDDFGRVVGTGGRTVAALKDMAQKSTVGREVKLCIGQPSSHDTTKHTTFTPSAIWQSRKTRELVKFMEETLGVPFKVEFIATDVRNNTVLEMRWTGDRTQKDVENITTLIACIWKKQGRYIVIGE